MLKDRLRQAREQAKLNQSQMARSLSVSPASLNRWEKGITNIPKKHIREIARITNIPYQWLINGETTTSLSTNQNIPTVSPVNTQSLSNKYIAYQGRPGAYSHLACHNRFPNLTPKPYESFEDCFAAVENGETSLAMIPIENSLGGRVADIHLILPHSGLYIIDEHFQNVQHMLWGLPNAQLADIRKIISHPQALAQCRSTIRSLNAKPTPFTDTAGACEYIQHKGDKSYAALASPLAGEVYKMQPLRQNMEDKLGNVTRFIIMSRSRIEPDISAGPCVTSFIFTLKSIPAALYKCLGGFATNSVNFIKLESYISIADYNTAAFYAEIEGHPADKAVERAFQEIHYFTAKVKILGTFPANPRRNDRYEG